MFDGRDKIFVVVDRITKCAHFMAIEKINSTKKIAQVLCKNIYKLYGLPKVIVTVRDAKFKGNFSKDFYNPAQKYLNKSSSCHPQIDG